MKRYGYEASDRELCGLLGVNEKKIRKLKRAASMGQIQSLNELLPGTEDFTLEESIASEEDLEEEAAARLDRERMKEELWRSVDELPDRLPVVVRMRYQDENTQMCIRDRLLYTPTNSQASGAERGLQTAPTSGISAGP